VKKRSFFISALLLACCAVANAQPCEKVIDSYLYEPAYCLDNLLRGQAQKYVPQPGDVMLATDKNLFWKITHDLAFAFEPHNSALVVARRDGSLATLEAGPNDTMRIDMLAMLPHLKEYADKGPVWIRKRKAPLSAEQSACLTDFAERQNGKRFGLGRLGVQLTPFRDRGPFRTAFLGKPRGDRQSYYCSELVLEALVAAGAVDAATTRPSASYPHDLFFERSHNPYINKHMPLACDWEPPARWVDCVR
jgi:hypothetical protein